MKSTLRSLALLLALVSLANIPSCGGGGNSTNSTNGGDDGAAVISIAEINGVMPPSYYKTPVTTITETDQYTGNVTWSGSPVNFAASTVYTATITLTAKPGYTLTGVGSNFFFVPGAASVTNNANTGVITATFPATGLASDIAVVFQDLVQTGGTSGTADSTGLTLTFDVNPTTLTADNITVYRATKGVLSGSGTTRNLTISNINNVANGEMVTVSITSPAGYSINDPSRMATVYRALTIGMYYLGGKLAYILQPGDPGYIAGKIHGLIAATDDQGLVSAWALEAYQKKAVTDTDTVIGTGFANTKKIMVQNNKVTSGYAAVVARGYGEGGYSDWYLPSIDAPLQSRSTIN